MFFLSRFAKNCSVFIGYSMSDDAAEGRYCSLNISRVALGVVIAPHGLCRYGGLMSSYQFDIY
ncbi:hypothetical protein EKL28_15390 [Staphylococcus aureus]|nr:hypothetical protein EKL28_15390 [Staphylococcus aureus]